MLHVSNRKKIWALAFFLAAALGCFGVSHYWHTGLKSPGAEVVQQDAKIKVTAHTDLIQKIHYLKCGDEEIYHMKPPEQVIGMNYSQIGQNYPEWEIEKFDVTEIVMSMKVDSYCHEHANNQFIGLKDGFVAVFYGKPGSKALLKEVTKISADHLATEDLAALKRGMPVQSREELLQTLEGLQER